MNLLKEFLFILPQSKISSSYLKVKTKQSSFTEADSNNVSSTLKGENSVRLFKQDSNSKLGSDFIVEYWTVFLKPGVMDRLSEQHARGCVRECRLPAKVWEMLAMNALISKWSGKKNQLCSIADLLMLLSLCSHTVQRSQLWLGDKGFQRCVCVFLCVCMCVCVQHISWDESFWFAPPRLTLID